MRENGLVDKTIGEFLEENNRRYGNQDAVVYCENGIRYDWHGLNQICDQAAKGFIALGINRGDHVAVFGTNRPFWLIVQLAVAKIGAVLVTINPEWKVQELEYVLKQSDSKALVMQDRFVKKSDGNVFEYDYVKIFKKIAPAILPELENVILVSDTKEKGMLNWEELLAKGVNISKKEYLARKKSVEPMDAVLIQYTSGTTGFPKGATLSHFNIVNNALSGAENMELSYEDKICGPVPYYHIFGSVLLNMCALVVGATTVIPSEHFKARKVLEAIEKEKCTAIHGVPTMFISELADPEFFRFDLSSLRTGIIAGASCPTQLMEDIVHKMGASKITIVYGLSEASPITHQTRPDDSVEKRVSTVGRPLRNIEAKIIDPETLKELEVNKVGEIWVKGYNVMLGYYKKPEETRDTMVDGWLRTGDLGIKNEEGYYNIVGRLKEMFIVGGHNVYPLEVEKALRSIFGKEIEDVYVIGVPHLTLQEIGAAVIKLRPNQFLDQESIKIKLKDFFEWPKIPKYIKFVDDFSTVMTVTGKIQRHELKRILIKEFGLEELTRIKTA